MEVLYEGIVRYCYLIGLRIQKGFNKMEGKRERERDRERGRREGRRKGRREGTRGQSSSRPSYWYNYLISKKSFQLPKIYYGDNVLFTTNMWIYCLYCPLDQQTILEMGRDEMKRCRIERHQSSNISELEELTLYQGIPDKATTTRLNRTLPR